MNIIVLLDCAPAQEYTQFIVRLCNELNNNSAPYIAYSVVRWQNEGCHAVVNPYARIQARHTRHTNN